MEWTKKGETLNSLKYLNYGGICHGIAESPHYIKYEWQICNKYGFLIHLWNISLLIVIMSAKLILIFIPFVCKHSYKNVWKIWRNINFILNLKIFTSEGTIFLSFSVVYLYCYFTCIQSPWKFHQTDKKKQNRVHICDDEHEHFI